jgi:hypothetical protein
MKYVILSPFLNMNGLAFWAEYYLWDVANISGINPFTHTHFLTTHVVG